MSNSNGMYNVLNIFKKLAPTPEQTVKAEAKAIYESVEAKGSVMQGVTALERKLAEQLESVKALSEEVKNPYAVGMAAAKKQAGITKTPAHNLPKKVVKKGHEIAKEIDEDGVTEGPSGPRWQEVISALGQGYPDIDPTDALKPLMQKYKVSYDYFDKLAQQQGYKDIFDAYAEFEELPTSAGPTKIYDGRSQGMAENMPAMPSKPRSPVTKKPVTPFGKQKQIAESINFAEMMKDHDDSVSEMLNELQQDINDFKRTGNASDKLEAFLKIHSHSKRKLTDAVRPENVPAVQRKQANINFPATLDQVFAPGDNISDVRNIRKSTGRDTETGARIEPSKELDELAHLAGLTMESKSLDENIVIGDMAAEMEEQQGKINVSTNMSSDGQKNVSINADGNAADALMQMLKMAGMGNSEAHAQLAAQGEMEPECDDGAIEVEMDEGEAEYANVPSEEYQGIDPIVHQGADMNREKKQFKKEYPGDNPMANRTPMEQANPKLSFGRDLMAEYQALKKQK